MKGYWRKLKNSDVKKLSIYLNIFDINLFLF